MADPNIFQHAIDKITELAVNVSQNHFQTINQTQDIKIDSSLTNNNSFFNAIDYALPDFSEKILSQFDQKFKELEERLVDKMKNHFHESMQKISQRKDKTFATNSIELKLEQITAELKNINQKIENFEKNQTQILKLLEQNSKNLETCHKSVDKIYLEKDENRGLLCQLREEILHRADKNEVFF